MSESDSQKRNWLGTVVFTDIVGYSKCPVDQQINIKEHFNQLISETIADTEETERVVIDTGDGIALCFLGDPEHAIVSSMDLRAEVVLQRQGAPIPYEVRTGINVGPVRLVTDINGRFNVLGDGINVAQRVMSFASPNQVLASRAFYDVVWCLSEAYSDLFQYYGVRKDKHAREHVLYEVVTGEPETITIGLTEEPAPVMEEHTRVIRSRLANDTAPISNAEWDAEVLRRIENELMLYIGPLAKVVVRKEAARAMSLEDLQVRIAKSIPAGEKRQAYMAKMSAEDKISGDYSAHQTVALDPEPELQAASPGGDVNWPPDLLATLQDRLAEYVGPLAAMLVRKASRRATDKQDLIERLALEIEDSNDRDRFLRQNIRK
jgi:class 3 adenylate cyclase